MPDRARDRELALQQIRDQDGGLPTDQRRVRYPCRARNPFSRIRRVTRCLLHVSPASETSLPERGHVATIARTSSPVSRSWARRATATRLPCCGRRPARCLRPPPKNKGAPHRPRGQMKSILAELALLTSTDGNNRGAKRQRPSSVNSSAAPMESRNSLHMACTSRAAMIKS